MKKLLPLILALGMGLGAGAYWAGGKKQAQFRQAQEVSQSDWEDQKRRLEEALAAERNKPPQIRTVYKEVPASYTNKLSPAQILERLIQLKPDEDSTRNQTYRKVIYYMQGMAEAGPVAFPLIQEFLAQNLDVDYSEYDVSAAGERTSRGGFATRNLVRTDFLVPPSLRLGLLGVLGEVGGPEAEVILAGTLATCARGVEVAYLARMLQDLAPDRYREPALQAARDLLTNPPPYESPNRLDENAKAFLYQVMAMYNDTSFAPTAQTLILDPEGKVDRSALQYLDSVMKEHAVPAILAAYSDPRLTSSIERSRLLNAALVYAGPSVGANAMFTQMITNIDVPSGMRAYTVQGLAGSSQIDPPKDPYTIQTRIQLLDTLRLSVHDARLLRTIDSTRQNLEKMLTGGGTPN
jgi:hypothetical protein